MELLSQISIWLVLYKIYIHFQKWLCCTLPSAVFVSASYSASWQHLVLPSSVVFLISAILLGVCGVEVCHLHFNLYFLDDRSHLFEERTYQGSLNDHTSMVKYVFKYSGYILLFCFVSLSLNIYQEMDILG